MQGVAQDLWRLDSLMSSWPVARLTLEGRAPGRERVFPAVVTEGLYARLQQDAPGFPVFADTLVAHYANLLGEHRREQFRILLGMAESHFPVIDHELEQQELPPQLKYLPMALSAMNNLASSNTGEAGLWMLTYPIAMRYGLTVTATIDERLDPVKSSRVAALYLRDLHERYHDWGLAVMVFACGPANVTRALAQAGGAADLRALYPFFTAGHRPLMPQFMAMIHLSTNAAGLGLAPVPLPADEATDSLLVEDDVDMLQLARLLEIPPAQLRHLNPVHIGIRATRGLVLRVPSGTAQRYAHALLLQSRIRETTASLAAPSDTLAAPPPMEEIERQERKPDFTLYTVRSGDSLYSIAKRHPGVSPQQLKDYNRISDRIRPGQKIKIPRP
jgi:membrane-bound lytic murein transglycosylase D